MNRGYFSRLVAKKQNKLFALTFNHNILFLCDKVSRTNEKNTSTVSLIERGVAHPVSDE